MTDRRAADHDHVGPYTRVGPYTCVRPHTRVGPHTCVGPHTRVGPYTCVGPYTRKRKQRIGRHVDRAFQGKGKASQRSGSPAAVSAHAKSVACAVFRPP
ncbi:MAG: hypothetical protein J0L58_00750 [Burkholderiales bacterium]|nr:hypothetical protein [Burkholderiales bacterium]